MFRTLQSRLIFFFLLISLSGIILVSLAIQSGFFGSFREYLDTKRLEQVESVVEGLENEHRIFGTVTGETLVNVFHHHAMVDQLFLKFYDQNDIVIFDSTRHYNMMDGMMNHTMMPMPNEDELESDPFPIIFENQRIGTLIVYYPNDYVNIDSQFLKEFNKYILFAAITMILLSIIISIFISKRLTKGLRQVSDATRELQKHNLDIQIPNENQVEEVRQLALSFNELAASLKKQELLRKQFTNDLAHELRTPLATLRSQIEAFLDGVWEPTPDRLKQGHEELMRLVRLVDDLEKLLAAENPQIQLYITKINVNDVISSLRKTFKPLFEEKSIDFSTEVVDADYYFYADRDRFVQIMMNLLNNALKYTNQGGMVVLRTYQEDKQMCFSVEDNGQGISEEDLPHIFERFYRGEKSRNRKTGGVGIGLSIVKSLVEAHKGKVVVESRKKVGTKMVVMFPIVK